MPRIGRRLPDLSAARDQRGADSRRRSGDRGRGEELAAGKFRSGICRAGSAVIGRSPGGENCFYYSRHKFPPGKPRAVMNFGRCACAPADVCRDNPAASRIPPQFVAAEQVVTRAASFFALPVWGADVLAERAACFFVPESGLASSILIASAITRFGRA